MNFNINSLEEKFNNIDTYSMEINKSVNNFTNKKQIESVVEIGSGFVHKYCKSAS